MPLLINLLKTALLKIIFVHMVYIDNCFGSGIFSLYSYYSNHMSFSLSLAHRLGNKKNENKTNQGKAKLSINKEK